MVAETLGYYRDDPLNTPHDIDGPPIPGGPWMRTGYAHISEDGTFAQNNGKIAIGCVEKGCPEGEVAVFVGPNTRLNLIILHEHGFHPRGGLRVPFTGGDQPATEDAITFCDEIDRLQHAKLPDMMLGIYQATGSTYKEAKEKPEKIVPLVPITKHLGTYNVSRTGVLGLVDIEGRQFIAADNPKLRAKLEENGFRRAHTLEVPYANGEIPVVKGALTTADVEYFVRETQKNISYRRGLMTSALSV